ncbi:MAG: dihydrodipicolinate synthase family protein, partial [Parachlamydiaceae bacterium]
ARQAHFKLLPLFKGAFIETNPSPLKYLMKKCGLPSGPVRLPLVEVSRETEQKLDVLWQSEILISQN